MKVIRYLSEFGIGPDRKSHNAYYGEIHTYSERRNENERQDSETVRRGDSS